VPAGIPSALIALLEPTGTARSATTVIVEKITHQLGH
jgi:hypothetical protein